MAYDKKIIDFVSNNKALLTPREIIAVEGLDNYLFQNNRKVKAIIPSLERLKVGAVFQRICTADNDIAYLVKEVLTPETVVLNSLPPTTYYLEYNRYAPRDLINFRAYPEFSFFLGGTSGGDYQVSTSNSEQIMTFYADGPVHKIDVNPQLPLQHLLDIVNVGGGGGLTSEIIVRRTLVNDLILNFNNAGVTDILEDGIAFTFNFLIENI